MTPLEILFAFNRAAAPGSDREEPSREAPRKSVAGYFYDARPANGSKAIFRACLMAKDKRR